VEFGWSEADEAFRAEVRQALDELPPSWDRRPSSLGSSRRSATTDAFCRLLAERGLLVPHWPLEQGGRGATPWQQTILSGEMWGRGEPRGPQYMNVNWIGPALLRHGTPEQRNRFLPLIARGEVVWCQGFSEPDAGSDLASLRTRAVRDGDAYVIDGRKIWTSYARDASVCFLLARTGNGANSRREISIFLVPMDSEGLEVRPIDAVIGGHAFHELTFDGVRIPESLRLGPDGDGWQIMRDALASERVGNPRYIRAVAVLDELAAEQGWGEQDGSPGADPGALEDLGAALALCDAGRLLALRVVDGGIKGRDVTAEASAARAAIVLAERAVADVCADVSGLGGLVEDAVADGQFRNSLAAGIASGTYEMQLNTVAAGLLPRGEA
jgi:alkylation response protein AidB-like acyl-CoA dehydrogenase